MHLLPLNLGVLADHADAKDGNRWATTGVRVELFEGRYRVTATDTKQLLDVAGPVVASADDYPEWPALRDAPNGSTAALVPADKWKAFFATAKKVTGKRFVAEALKAVAVKLSPVEATLACTDRDSHKAEGTRLVEGKFPPVEVIWPKRKPTVTVMLDPEYVAQVAKTLATLADADDLAMSVEIIDDVKPVVFRVERRDGTVARGLVMPLGPKAGSPPVKVEADAEDAEAVSAVDRLAAELAAITAERDALLRELAEVKRERDAAVRDARECAAERDAARDEQARTPSRPAEVRTSAPPAPTPERKLTRRERLALQA